MDKKELKKQYARTIQPMGVYQIKNLKNGKVFIDSGLNVNGKINRSKFQLSHGSFPNRTLQEDFNALGIESFEFGIVDLLEPKENGITDFAEDLKMLEDMWLDRLQPFGDKGYNRRKKG